MRSLRLAVAGVSLLASTAFASPAVPQNGVDYITLSHPQPTQASGKQVEVIEFFMYHCPVCNALEPLLEDWVKQEGDRIQLRRVHIPYSGPNDPEAHLFLTLQALGKPDAINDRVFDAVHVQRLSLHDDKTILDWVSSNGQALGVDRTAFLNAWNSFGVLTRLHQLNRVMADYQVESAPTLIIDGRYQTSPATVAPQMSGTSDRNELFKATLQVADKLVSKAAQSK